MQHPLFRHDLVSQPVQEAGQRFIDVTDPDSGNTFRFYEVEYALACAMDGNRNLDRLSTWAKEELGLTPSREELSSVVSTLEDLGYLSSAAAPVMVEDPTPRPAPAPPPKSGDDVLLGAAGRSSMGRASTPAESPGSFDLGFAGKSPTGAARPTPPPADDVPLGGAGGTPEFGEGGAAATGFDSDSAPTLVPEPAPPPSPVGDAPGPSEVSIDLSKHLEVGAEDVKEAVRQSRAMPAVEPSFEAATPSGAAAVTLPSPPAKLAPPVPDMAAAAVEGVPEKEGSQLWIWLLILLIIAIGVAAALYYFLVLEADKAAPVERPAPVKKVEATPPPAPPLPSAVLEDGAAAEEIVTVSVDGTVTWLAAAGVEVEAEVAIAKLKGAAKLEANIAKAESRKKHYQRRLDRAAASGDKAAMADAEAQVNRKDEALAKLRADLEDYVRPAPIAGVFEPAVEVGSRVKAGTEVGKVTGEGKPSATFTLSEAGDHEIGAEIEVASKTDHALAAACTITAVEDKQLSVECPIDSGLAVGSDLVLK